VRYARACRYKPEEIERLVAEMRVKLEERRKNGEFATFGK
jgi:hypothetical protein